jgi:hypothetical protein
VGKGRIQKARAIGLAGGAVILTTPSATWADQCFKTSVQVRTFANTANCAGSTVDALADGSWTERGLTDATRPAAPPRAAHPAPRRRSRTSTSPWARSLRGTATRSPAGRPVRPEPRIGHTAAARCHVRITPTACAKRRENLSICEKIPQSPENSVEIPFLDIEPNNPLRSTKPLEIASF